MSGDHGEIKDSLVLGGADNVRIAPNGDVWVQNPDGRRTSAGAAKDATSR